MKNFPFNTAIIDWITKGGWLMAPLFLLSILALYAFIERLIVLTRQTAFSSKWVNALYVLILAGKLEEAITACNSKKTATAFVIESALKNVLKHTHSAVKIDINTVEKPIIASWQYILPKLEKNTSLLATIASIAPMIGFLGTVLGMIKAFYTLSTTTTTIVPQKLLAGGIYEAMITTAAGLIVALIAEVGLKYCTSRINTTAKRIDQIAYHLVEILKIP